MTAQAGDIGFHRDHDFTSWWIRWAEARKYGKDKGVLSPSHWNHVFMMISADSLVEATPSGVRPSNLSEYSAAFFNDLAIYRPTYPHPDGGAAAAAGMLTLVGERYDDLNLISDALYLLFNSTIRFGVRGRNTCSGAVAHELDLQGVDLGGYEDCDTPADVFSACLQKGWTVVT